MNLQPTLEDALILLRPLGKYDFEPLFEIAKDPLIWEQHPCKNRYKRDVFVEFFKDALDSKGALVVIDKLHHNVIGSSRFKPVKNCKHAIEIGWSFLARAYWGGACNRAVKTLMIDFAFESPEIEAIIFYIGNENIRSQKAVGKIGGVRITNLKSKYLVNRSQNDVAYCITRDMWKI